MSSILQLLVFHYLFQSLPIFSGAEDYKNFIPTALDGFNMKPISARIVGCKQDDGSFKFTYLLEWTDRGEKGPEQKEPDSDDSCSDSYEKKGIIDPFDEGTVPPLLALREIDGTIYHIVEDDGCVLRLQGNHQFNELMRIEAIEQGLYHPSCYTPREDLKFRKKSKNSLPVSWFIFVWNIKISGSDPQDVLRRMDAFPENG